MSYTVPMSDAVLAIKLLDHRRPHDVAIVTYGATDENITLECHTCSEVILTFDIEGDLLAEIETLVDDV